MPAAPKSKVTSVKFVIDCSIPVADQVFSTAQFEKYLHDRVKVNGHTNNFAEGGVTIVRDENKIEFSTTSYGIPKRYLKYLTKKYLKKFQLRDFLRVVASDKETYQLRYYKVGEEEDDEE